MVFFFLSFFLLVMLRFWVGGLGLARFELS